MVRWQKLAVLAVTFAGCSYFTPFGSIALSSGGVVLGLQDTHPVLQVLLQVLLEVLLQVRIR